MEKFRLIDRAYINSLIRKRPSHFHKGDCGRVLIIAGSEGMAGAAVLCARGALRSGAGLVRVCVPDGLIPILQGTVVEATCVKRSFSPEILEEYQAVILGPGLGTAEENGELVERVLKSSVPKMVIDADALNTIARENLFALLKTAAGRTVITPHPGEAASLLGCSPWEINRDRAGAVRALAEKTGAVVLLKGEGTLVHAAGGEIRINKTGNPGMATGGSGDVLSGIIGSFCAQGFSCLDAAGAGAYVHGMAGDLAAHALGEYGMIAEDLASTTALALKKILQEQAAKRKQQIVISAVNDPKKHKEN